MFSCANLLGNDFLSDVYLLAGAYTLTVGIPVISISLKLFKESVVQLADNNKSLKDRSVSLIQNSIISSYGIVFAISPAIFASYSFQKQLECLNKV